MEQSEIEKAIEESYKQAIDFIGKGDLLNAMAVAEKSISVHGKNQSCTRLYNAQSAAFVNLVTKTEDPDVRCTYLFSSLESFSKSAIQYSNSLVWYSNVALTLFELGQEFSSNAYYTKAIWKARQGLSLQNYLEMLDTQRYPQEEMNLVRKGLEGLIKDAEGSIHPDRRTTVSCSHTKVKKNQRNPMLDANVQEGAETMGRKRKIVDAMKLKSFWETMNVESKRDFLIVDIEKLKGYVAEKYGSEGRETLERDLASCYTKRRWRLWLCHTCLTEFQSSVEFRKHIERYHAQKFRHSKDLIPDIDESLREVISSGNWNPVNTAKAAEMIKSRILNKKEFHYDKGWCSDWPFASGILRRNTLQTIRQILISLLDHKLLSSSLWDFLKEFIGGSIELPGIPACCIVDCGLVNTPQGLCFLRHDQLEDVLEYLRGTTTDFSTVVVSVIADRFQKYCRVREHIHCDSEFSCLYLDRNLLRGKASRFDDEGKIKNQTRSGYYGWVVPQDDKTLLWLLDCPPDNEVSVFQRPKWAHNFQIWLAVLRILECKCRKLESAYKKKLNMQAYSKGLVEVEKLFEDQDKVRKRLPKKLSKWTSYARILLVACGNRVNQEGRDSDDTIGFLSVVRDVLEERRTPRLEVLEVREYLDRIDELSGTNDDSVIGSFTMLGIELSHKFHSIDTKILLNKKSRSELIDYLQKLSIIDYRSFLLPLLKRFLREKLENMIEMDGKESSVAAEAREQEGKRKSLK